LQGRVLWDRDAKGVEVEPKAQNQGAVGAEQSLERGFSTPSVDYIWEGGIPSLEKIRASLCENNVYVNCEHF